MQTEDERRKKRLARNRASARLRRLRKKTMVEAFEAEVAQLETAMNKLRSHKWGMGQSEVLKAALSDHTTQVVFSHE